MRTLTAGAELDGTGSEQVEGRDAGADPAASTTSHRLVLWYFRLCLNETESADGAVRGVGARTITILITIVNSNRARAARTLAGGRPARTRVGLLS